LTVDANRTYFISSVYPVQELVPPHVAPHNIYGFFTFVTSQ